MIKMKTLFFRVRGNGAMVYRIDTINRNRRTDMNLIATVNTRNGKIDKHGKEKITNEEFSEIETWIEARRKIELEREIDDAKRLLDEINATAHWFQAKATDEQVDALTDDYLFALHDLRNMILRRKAANLDK